MKYWRRIYIGGLADCSEIHQYKIRQQKLHATHTTHLCSKRTYRAPKMQLMTILHYFKRGSLLTTLPWASAAPSLSVEDQTHQRGAHQLLRAGGQSAKIYSANILFSSFSEQSAKYNSRQYFILYGMSDSQP